MTPYTDYKRAYFISKNMRRTLKQIMNRYSAINRRTLRGQNVKQTYLCCKVYTAVKITCTFRQPHIY